MPDVVDDGLAREAALFDEAIRSLVALPEGLRQALDGAALTGDLPAARDLAAAIVAAEEDGPALPERYRSLLGVEELVWCTIRHRYGWGLPSAEALDLAERAAREAGGRMVEVGAGSGYWAAVLAAPGIRVAACDDGSWRADTWREPWHAVHRQDGIEVARENPEVPILIVWADPTSIGARLSEAMSPGQALLRVGIRAVTGGPAFNRACAEWHDETAAAEAVSSTGCLDPMELLVRRSTPRMLPQGTVPEGVHRLRPPPRPLPEDALAAAPSRCP